MARIVQEARCYANSVRANLTAIGHFATGYRGNAGVLDDVKIDDEGDITPNDPSYSDLTFYDRGPGGVAMGCHNAVTQTFQGMADSWSRGYHAVMTWLTPCSAASGHMPTSIDWYGSLVGQITTSLLTPIGQGGVLGMPRTDGLTDGIDTLQGVRAYNSNAGVWTAPDAYEGDIHDPKSQKPFMWNDNNPVSYSDPSGYEAACVSVAQPCISPEAADKIGAGLFNLYKLAIGSDIDTLRDPSAGFWPKALAVVLIGSNFLGPDELIGRAALGVGIKGIRYSGKVISQAARGFGEFHSFTQQVDAALLDIGKVSKSGSYVEFSAAGRYPDASGAWHSGTFELGGFVESDGTLEVTHRFFKPK